MSAPQSQKSALSPSPFVLAVAVVIFALIGIGILALLQTALVAPTPAQTGASAKQNVAPPNRAPQQNAAATAIVTEPAVTEEPTEPPTPDIPTPTQPPEPTAYIPGPTAQFTTPIPLDEWLVYADEQAGFRIQYPPDWYMTTTPLEERVFGSTTQFLSYDPKDPNPVPKGTTKPENFIKLEITVDSLDAMGKPFLPDESLANWVVRNYPRSGDEGGEYVILDEVGTTLGDTTAFRQVSSFHGVEGVNFFIHRGNDMIFVGYQTPSPGGFNEQIIDSMLESFELLP